MIEKFDNLSIIFSDENKKQTKEDAIALIKRNPLNIKYVEEQTDDICFLALRMNIASLKEIREQTDEICRFALSLKNDYSILSYIKKPKIDFFIKCFKINKEAFYLMEDKQSKRLIERLYEEDLKTNGRAIPKKIFERFDKKILKTCADDCQLYFKMKFGIS